MCVSQKYIYFAQEKYLNLIWIFCDVTSATQIAGLRFERADQPCTISLITSFSHRRPLRYL